MPLQREARGPLQRALLSTAVALLVIAGLVGMHAVGPAPTPAAAPQAAAASHVAHGPAPAAGHPAAQAAASAPPSAPHASHDCPACVDDAAGHMSGCSMAPPSPVTVVAAPPALSEPERPLVRERAVVAVRTTGADPPSLTKLSISRT